MESDEFRRHYERKRYTADVIFYSDNQAFAGTLKNISAGGAFVVSPSVFKVDRNDVITISIPFTSGKKRVMRQAKVMWTNAEGFAVEFL